MDTHNRVAGGYGNGTTLGTLDRQCKKVSGLDLNFKVYNVVDVNAFACGDGNYARMWRIDENHGR